MNTLKLEMQILCVCSIFASYCTNASPSFDCTNVKSSSIEQLICEDAVLAELDQKLAAVYKKAELNVAGRILTTLKATQHGWIKGRNDCWKDEAPRSCVSKSYQMRISEIQAEYDLIKASSSFIYTCLDDPKKPLEVTYYPTEISTAKAKRGDQTSFMYGKPVTGGVLYNGPNESISIQKESMKLKWGYGSVETPCNKTN